MSDREMPYQDVNAVLEVEDTLRVCATDCGIDLCLSNGQRIRGARWCTTSSWTRMRRTRSGRVMGLAKLTGDVTYRAACGHEVYDTRPIEKPKRIPEVLMGWKGDSRADKPTMQVDCDPPERCRVCKHLRKDLLNFYSNTTKEFFHLPMWFCPTYKVREQGGGGE